MGLTARHMCPRVRRFAYKPTVVTIANVTMSLAPYPTAKHKSLKSPSVHAEVSAVPNTNRALRLELPY